MNRRAWILVGLALVLLVVNGLAAQREAVMARGRTVLLALAPVDPRSLIQGDYMRLDYAVGRDVQSNWPAEGRLVMRVGPDEVGEFVRVDDGAPLAADEVRLRYRLVDGRLRIGAESFLFQEGKADVYAAARFAELKVGSDGTAVLTGLRDADRRPLGG